MATHFEHVLKESEEAANLVKKIEMVLAKSRKELTENMKQMNLPTTSRKQSN